MKTSKKTFADSELRGLGRLSSEPETLEDVALNGWKAENWRSDLGYIPINGAYEVPLYRKKNLSTTRLRRRPCDGLSLQSPELQAFEARKADFFPHPYQLDRHLGLEQGLQSVLGIARDELFELDYLHPLSGIIQAVRPDSRIPFIARCWDFGSGQGALIKTARLRMDGLSEPMTGACICYEPPTRELLAAVPDNFFVFRTVVGHEIGHYWWDNLPENEFPEALACVRDRVEAGAPEGQELLEQVVSLFSIFVIMYRGYWARRAYSADEIGEAWSKLGFESQAAARMEKGILDRLVEWETLPVFEPRVPSRDYSGAVESAEHKLPSDAVDAIRTAARELVDEATHMPFASVAAVIGQRKLDTFISYGLTDFDEYPAWRLHQRRAEHLDAPAVTSRWNEITLTLPDPGEDPLPLGHRLEVARHLAHIRLHGDWATHASPLSRDKDVERECSAESRDLARVLALATHVMHGETRRRALKLELAELLLDLAPEGLGYLSDYAAIDFQWCCEDPDCPEAQERFLARIHEVSQDGAEVHCDFWDEEGDLLGATLPIEAFRATGFENRDLAVGSRLKLFGVEGEDGYLELRPVPVREAEEIRSTTDLENVAAGSSGAGWKEDGVRAPEPASARMTVGAE